MNKNLIKPIVSLVLTFCLLFSVSVFKTSAHEINEITSGSDYYVRNIKSGLYLDVSGGGSADCTNVQIYNSNNSNAQKWQLVYTNDGYYLLRSKINPYNYLGVESNFSNNWSNVCIRNDSGSPKPSYVKWHLVKNDNSNGYWDGTYRLESACSNNSKSLDTYSGGTASETNVIQYEYSGDLNLEWVLESVTVDGGPYDWDFIDSGGHCDITNYSKYGTELGYAMNTWNSYKAGVLRYDTSSTINDVDIKNEYKENGELGITDPDADEIRLNTYNLDASTVEAQKTITHELGHALGLDDHNDESGNIMCQGLRHVITLSHSDKASYDTSYNAN